MKPYELIEEFVFKIENLDQVLIIDEYFTDVTKQTNNKHPTAYSDLLIERSPHFCNILAK